MRPQFNPCASIIGREIDGIADEDVYTVRSRVTAGSTAVDVSHLPCGMVGGIVRPQFSPCASIIGGEIDGITNEELYAIPRVTVTTGTTAVDVSHLPCGMVGGIVRPQFSPCAADLNCGEIEGVANEEFHVFSRVNEVSHLPCGMVGGIVRPQFMPSASINGGEIEGVANEEGHAISRGTVS